MKRIYNPAPPRFGFFRDSHGHTRVIPPPIQYTRLAEQLAILGRLARAKHNLQGF